MAYHICPVCGLEDSIETECYTDSDGDEMHIRHFTYAIIESQECKCILSDEQQDAVCAADTCEPQDDY